MFSVLFSPIVWYVIVGIAILAIIGILCGTYPTLRWIFATVLVVTLVGSAVYSCVQLNTYYTAEGGLYGYINSMLVQNEAKKIDELSFELSSISLAPSSNPNEYTATFYMDDVLKVDKDTTYGVYVNGVPCSNINYGNDHISGKLIYTFYDYSENEITSDILDLKISMFENYTTVFIKTDGGSEITKYWNSYFDKNGFTVEIKPFGYVS